VRFRPADIFRVRGLGGLTFGSEREQSLKRTAQTHGTAHPPRRLWSERGLSAGHAFKSERSGHERGTGRTARTRRRGARRDAHLPHAIFHVCFEGPDATLLREMALSWQGLGFRVQD
jgi:hypothetical protein